MASSLSHHIFNDVIGPVIHGFVRCGAVGTITGVGNALPKPVLRLIELCEQAACGDVQARRLAEELDNVLLSASIIGTSRL